MFRISFDRFIERLFRFGGLSGLELGDAAIVKERRIRRRPGARRDRDQQRQRAIIFFRQRVTLSSRVNRMRVLLISLALQIEGPLQII